MKIITKFYRLFISLCILALIVVQWILQTPGLAQAACGSPANEIEAENCLAGNPASEWDVSGAGDANIQGYATDISVDQGGTVYFKVDTNATDYRLDIYRLGYYQGNGARKITTIQPSAALPQTQPACLFDGTDAVNLLDCGNWTVSASWSIPTDAVSGIYIAKLVREDSTPGASHITFIVRDDNGSSDILFQTSDTTWQAYNDYGGYSLYAGYTGHAHKVSYNRPFRTRTNSTEDFLFNSEYPMLRWLERNGYDVSYFTDMDTDRYATELLEHKVFMSVGHDEYWSAGQRAAVEAARAARVHLAFFSGNEIYWKTRWESSAVSGTAYRTLVSYKEGSLAGSEHYNCYENNACDPDPAVWTGLWRDGCGVAGHDGCRPENALSGNISWKGTTTTIQVPAADGDLRFWRSSAVAAASGTTALSANTLGYEWDFEQYANAYPDGRFWLSTTDADSVTHHLSLYRASSGALVFGAGTVQWSWGLDGNHDRGSSTEDASMQQATVNLLADMGVQPVSLQAGLVAASASTDTTAPTASIVAPTTGANVSSGSTVTISGTAADVGGLVAAVEISLDNGTTWQMATGRSTWSYNWAPGAAGSSATILSRAVDDSGNIGAASAAIVLNIIERVCPCSIWDSSFVPTVPYANDGQPIEVGVKFRSSQAGTITGLRFYKGTGNTGTHTGHLWSLGGSLMAEAVFTNETASGWQEVTFTTPVPIDADTTYVASYHSASGGYAYDDVYFTGAYPSSPLIALATGDVDGPNGVYKYGTSGFPTQAFQASNYWVDVIFENEPQTFSIWDNDPTPTNPAVTDGQPIEVGVKFQSSVGGKIVGLRFYKGAANTGTHTGHLWAADGTPLATEIFTGEFASGWQVVTLASPVSISANTTYVASYFSPSGYFALDANYFTTAFNNPPLRALADEEAGPNGMYLYTASGFPTGDGNGSNYWVDVIFTPDTPLDLTPPTVVTVTPANSTSGVDVNSNITAQFNEAMNDATITGSTFELRDAGNTLVTATVSYASATLTVTLDPGAALAYNSVYTARVIGGAVGVADLAGNRMAENTTWTFTTSAPPPPPPYQGPGGPILVISTTANPFSNYYAEILRTEGLNAFTVADITTVNPTLLNSYDVVILGEMPLDAAQVTLFSDWVNAGGNLIAMRPDKDLASLLGLTDASATLSNAYLRVNTAIAPGSGIVNQTVQFHGTADEYTLNGATEVATLYSNGTTATTYPAVTLRAVGSSGGQAAAFTYDLARSVVYTRQGNPAWSGDERDGVSPIRSDDQFFGAKSGDVQADWIDLSKVAIPQADEQQRLLANMILSMNLDQMPLPRFWYFPRGEKAVVVMTADDHSSSNIPGRLDQYKAFSPSGCDLDDWECVRSSIYIYPGSALTTEQANAYTADGFEIGVHIDTSCGNFTQAQLQTFYTDQLAAFATRFPALPLQDSERTHCIAWSTWTISRL